MPRTRYSVVSAGEKVEWEGISIRAVYADHGELAPDAVGYLLTIDNIMFYHAGDTAYRPEEISKSLNSYVDVMIAPINGTYGNMIAGEALQLAAKLKPVVLIPCHFWMFLEHVVPDGKGDPATLLSAAPRLAPDTMCKVMAPGETMIYTALK